MHTLTFMPNWTAITELGTCADQVAYQRRSDPSEEANTEVADGASDKTVGA